MGLARSIAFAEGDTYWQITTGAEILPRRTTHLVENASWNAADTPWHPNSWGLVTGSGARSLVLGALGLA